MRAKEMQGVVSQTPSVLIVIREPKCTNMYEQSN